MNRVRDGRQDLPGEGSGVYLRSEMVDFCVLRYFLLKAVPFSSGSTRDIRMKIGKFRKGMGTGIAKKQRNTPYLPLYNQVPFLLPLTTGSSR